jgi:hypothetical protein
LSSTPEVRKAFLVGAGGIGSISGNTEAGAVIGGGVGLLYDVF